MEEENQVRLDQEVFPDRWEIKVQEALKVRVDQLDSAVFPDLWVQWANLVEIVIMAKLRFVWVINMTSFQHSFRKYVSQ